MTQPQVLRRAEMTVTLLIAAMCGHVALADTAIPNTLAGKRAAALIAAFNTGDDAAFRKFETEHRAKSAARRRSMADRVAGWRSRHADWGKLTVRNVLSHGDHDMLVVVDPQGVDGWIHLAFELEKESPHRVVGVRIEGPVAPKSSEASNKELDDKRRKRVVNDIADELIRAYVFEDVGQAMADDIRGRLATGEYDGIQYSYSFAQRLTDDLRAICHDKHLRVIPRIPMTSRGERETPGSRFRPSPEGNYGFVNVEVLPGNVGYIRFNQFAGGAEAQPTAAAAMAFVANTEALIFDVRTNGGGSPQMINFLSGYLFDKPVHLNTFHHRAAGVVHDTYSDGKVPGKHYGQVKPVYVLTSGYTFSAAEEFTYNLKHLKRATIVGETTGGGAHPVSMTTLNKYFTLKIPDGRAVNPITKTNWEGVGVIPHVDVAADLAKETAYQLALEAIKAQGKATSVE